MTVMIELKPPAAAPAETEEIEIIPDPRASVGVPHVGARSRR